MADMQCFDKMCHNMGLSIVVLERRPGLQIILLPFPLNIMTHITITVSVKIMAV